MTDARRVLVTLPWNFAVELLLLYTRSSSFQVRFLNLDPPPSKTHLLAEFLNSHLDAIVMNTYINDNVSRSIGHPFLVEVTWIGDKAIKLLASAFVPSPQAWAQQKYQSISGQSLGVESLPIGLLPLDDHAVKTACLAHFESILKDPSFPDLLTGYRSPLSRQILGAICGLYHSTVGSHYLSCGGISNLIS